MKRFIQIKVVPQMRMKMFMLNQIARSSIKKQYNVVMNFFRLIHNFIKLIRQKDCSNMKKKRKIIHEMKQYKEEIKQVNKAYLISKNVDSLKLTHYYEIIQLKLYFISGQEKQSKQFYVEALKKGYQDIKYLKEKISQI